MNDGNKPRNAILWPRISFDKMKDEHGVNDQEHYLQEFADKLGWGVGYVIKENDVSASKRTRKVPNGNGGYTMRTNRPVLRRILKMIEDGETDGVIVRDIDRALRDPRDLEDLIDACDSRNPFIPVESITGRIRLRSKYDGMGARIYAAFAKDETDKLAERLSNTKKLRVMEGKFDGGPRPYGFQKDGVTIIPREAREIVRAGDAVLDGESLTSIIKDMNRRGVPTTGKFQKRTEGTSKRDNPQWGVVGLRQILMRPRTAGLTNYHGGETFTKAVWDPIIPEEKWRAICAILTDSSRRTSPGPKPVHLGTNIYYCGVCLEEDEADSFMVGQVTDYRCKEKSHFHRKKAPIDELVIRIITARLALPESVKLLKKPPRASVDHAGISADSANIRRSLRELEESYKAGRTKIGQFERMTASLEAQLEQNEKAVQVSIEESPLAGIAGHPDAAVIWTTLPLARQRAIIRDLCEVTLYRSHYQPNQYHRFEPGSVQIDWLK